MGGGGGAPVSRGTFGMKREPKSFPEMMATGGGEGRENKCNLNIFQKSKGQFATGERGHFLCLLKTWGLAPTPVPTPLNFSLPL